MLSLKRSKIQLLANVFDVWLHFCSERSILVQRHAKYCIINLLAKDPGCVQVRSHLEGRCRGGNAAVGWPHSTETALLLLSWDSASVRLSRPHTGPPPLGPFLYPVREKHVLLKTRFVALTPPGSVAYRCCFWPHSKSGLAAELKPQNI